MSQETIRMNFNSKAEFIRSEFFRKTILPILVAEQKAAKAKEANPAAAPPIENPKV